MSSAATSVFSGRLFRSFVNGRFVDPSSSATSSSSREHVLRFAATNEVVGRLVCADDDLVDDAVAAAEEARPAWAARSPAERGRVLLRAADAMESDLESLARDDALDTGRPISETRLDIGNAADCLRWHAGAAPTLGGSYVPLAGGSWSHVVREPLGTTVGIGAWNYPTASAVWKAAPALVHGNTMVFKPSEETPRAALRLAETLTERCGLPPGVLSVVLGDGATGAALCRHADVRKISFTGSFEIGRRVAEIAAADAKRVTTELGGKSPLVIFPDADLENAVEGAMLANWWSCGQVCSNGTRVFVHESIAERFLERLIERTSRLRVGSPLDDDTDVGPMITRAHMDRVRSYVDLGAAEGATIVHGSSDPLRLDDPALEDGNFLSPVVLTDCRDDMRVMREEIFGMVMAVSTFSDEEEVVARANDSRFGLAAGVFTNDLRRAHRVAAALKAGMVWINSYNLSPPETPWGGVDHSGLGRENGIAAAEAWTQTKSIYVEMNDKVDCPYP